MAIIGTLFIISAPSGAGKTTLYKMALENIDGLTPSISYTTRQKRDTELEGKDYFFVTDDEFGNMIAESRFVEWAEVHGNKYGTPREVIDTILESGKDVLFDIDVQGAKSLKAQFSESVLIFILPPSFDILKERLSSRQTDESEDIKVRLENALEEIKQLKEFDYLIINNYVTKALNDLKAIIAAQRSKVRVKYFDMKNFIGD